MNRPPSDPPAPPVEQVLVVPTALFRELGEFQGVCTDVERYLAALLDPRHIRFEPRDQMELDPNFKQLIPYCIFRHGDQLFQYRRGKLQGVGRLRGKRSIGVGGHISSTDQGSERPVYLEALQRELDEEVAIETRLDNRLIGLLNDDSTEVGRVHLGLVHLIEVEEPKVRAREASMLEAGFVPARDMLGDLADFETWSQLCLEHLFRQGGEAGTSVPLA